MTDFQNDLFSVIYSQRPTRTMSLFYAGNICIFWWKSLLGFTKVCHRHGDTFQKCIDSVLSRTTVQNSLNVFSCGFFQYINEEMKFLFVSVPLFYVVCSFCERWVIPKKLVGQGIKCRLCRWHKGVPYILLFAVVNICFHSLKLCFMYVKMTNKAKSVQFLCLTCLHSEI